MNLVARSDLEKVRSGRNGRLTAKEKPSQAVRIEKVFFGVHKDAATLRAILDPAM